MAQIEGKPAHVLDFDDGLAIERTIHAIASSAAKGGWTSYTPLSDISETGPAYDLIFNGQTLWLIGFIFLITSSLLGAVNFITTIIQLRAKGLTWMRLPFFVWAQFVTAFLLLLAFPSGRLRTSHERQLVRAAVAVVALGYMSTALFVSHFPEPAAYTSCGTECPDNAFNLVSWGGLGPGR